MAYFTYLSFIVRLSPLLLPLYEFEYMSFFQNKVVVITGGSSGIGAALVQQFLAAGARVATCGRNGDKLAALAANCPSESLFTAIADVGVEADCKAFIGQVINRFQSIDILVNNAGMSMRALFDELDDLEVLHKLMDINFWGSVYCTWYAMEELKKSKGTVVGISSIAGYRGLPGRAGYSASKFALQGFLEVLRTENLYTGLHVMWVSPGFTASNIRNTALNKHGSAQAETPLEESKLMSAEEVAKYILDAIRKKKRTRVLTLQGKLTVLMNKLFPSFTDKLVYNHFANEPNSPLKKTK